MRRARFLFPILIAALVAVVGVTYYKQRRDLDAQAPRRPAPLPDGIEGQAEDWFWTQSVPGRTVVEIRARRVRQEKDSARLELGGVRLRIFREDGASYDYVESDLAEFSPTEERLYSEGDVTITLGVPSEGEPSRQLVSIKTSGAAFESRTGKATTDRVAEFQFENGEGRSRGATYDPQLRELMLHSEAEVVWRGGARPMKVEAGTLVYKEIDSAVLLGPWSRLTRENSVIDAGSAFAVIENGAIRRLEAKQARGKDELPGRTLFYEADELAVSFAARGLTESARGIGNARIASKTPASETVFTANRIDMDFVEGAAESELEKALGTGKAVIETRPLGGREEAPEAKVLRSEVVELAMRPGGAEIDTVATHTPGEIEFIPTRPGHRRRQLLAERLWIHYGRRNVIQSFRAVTVETATAGPAARTWSDNLLADFSEGSGELQRLEQWDNFRYESGDRKAWAERAVFEQASDRVTLRGQARVTDPGGSTSAALIRLNQTSGQYEAEERVASSRNPEGRADAGGMFNGDGPVLAVADRMRTSDGNRLIVYEGNAVLWQGGNRVKAHRIEIDRDARRLVAHGSVETLLTEAEGGQTSILARALVYTDEDRQALYTGGVRLRRPRLHVDSLELRVILAEPGSASRLERAFADGKVKIVEHSPGRSRTGTGERAIYEVAEERIHLRGGDPRLVDSAKGTTRGEQLTYWAGDDRLLVNGQPEQPAATRLRRRSP
ncbi:MAG: LPS export ABC transporter periplasmic protein LptC [Bryobacterales bacterium]|nr:LPS export ABC transporter periplasmic protein LptC [Bryobacterales bacterium]